MTRPKSPQNTPQAEVQLSFRVPVTLAEAIDAEVERRQAARPGTKVHRPEVIREVLLRAFGMTPDADVPQREERKPKGGPVRTTPRPRTGEGRAREPRLARPGRR